MTVYHPPQRAVPTLVLSLSRWLRATFHLPKLHAFDEHLARGRTFFTLTDVSLAPGPPLPYLALRVAAAHVLVPRVPERELLLPSAPGTRSREVSCYLEHLAVHGSLHVLPGVRTSDYFAHQTGFIALRGCRLVPPLAGAAEPIPILFVNAGAIVAVAEGPSGIGEEHAAGEVSKTPVPA